MTFKDLKGKTESLSMAQLLSGSHRQRGTSDTQQENTLTLHWRWTSSTFWRHMLSKDCIVDCSCTREKMRYINKIELKSKIFTYTIKYYRTVNSDHQLWLAKRHSKNNSATSLGLFIVFIISLAYFCKIKDLTPFRTLLVGWERKKTSQDVLIYMYMI